MVSRGESSGTATTPLSRCAQSWLATTLKVGTNQRSLTDLCLQLKKRSRRITLPNHRQTAHCGGWQKRMISPPPIWNRCKDALAHDAQHVKETSSSPCTVGILVKMMLRPLTSHHGTMRIAVDYHTCYHFLRMLLTPTLP